MRKLAKLRIKAIRRGVWFKILNRAERAQIDLTVKVVKRVRSPLLTKVLTFLMRKLSKALEGRVKRLTREVGRRIAEKLSLIAQSWGYVSASLWKIEYGFKRFLAIMYMNSPGVFGL
jgi:hypothetical protein